MLKQKLCSITEQLNSISNSVSEGWRMENAARIFLSSSRSFFPLSIPRFALVCHYFSVIIMYVEKMFGCLGSDSTGSLLEFF